jgi:hypothetical protein
MNMAKTLSRPQRWAQAASNARAALDGLRDAQEGLIVALSELEDIKAEYQDWYDNMPDSTRDGPTGEKLSEIIELDFELDDSASIEDFEEVVSNAEDADLPLGFGRD